jgi:hypothetical protein
MNVALFPSEKDSDVFAFTTDEKGANLPRTSRLAGRRGQS